MSIKKSSLEKKLIYRVTKVFFLILPILVILLLLNGKVNVCDISQKITLDTIQKDIVYIAFGLTSYYLIIVALWRLFLYITFGGLEDDTKKEGLGQSTGAKPAPPKIMQIIPILIILTVFIIFILSEMGYITLPKISTNPIGSPTGSPKAKIVPKSTCFTTSAQMANPCHSVKNGVGVFGVIVPASCNCPSDTTYAQMDNITAGGPYKICTCN